MKIGKNFSRQKAKKFPCIETARKNSNFTLASLRLKIPDTHRQKDPFSKANDTTPAFLKHTRLCERQLEGAIHKLRLLEGPIKQFF